MKKILILLLLFTNLLFSQISINLTKKNGIYEIPVVLNNSVNINFMVDTGCAETSIPLYLAHTLIKTGTVTKSDKLKTKKYIMANGTVVECNRFTIKYLKIGDIIIENVDISISESTESPLLLGNNVLSRFKKVTFDFENNILILE